MCVNCGCSDHNDTQLVNPKTGESVFLNTNNNSHHFHTHTLPDGTVITHSHTHPNHGELSQVAPKTRNTTISLEEDILAKNSLIAAQNRGWLKGRNVFAVNFMSSPGAGKTTLLIRTIKDLKNTLNISVIVGDQETTNDSQKIRETSCPVIQINTGAGCHLDAAMIEQGLEKLNPLPDSVVMIENVGNLVCPALFDLGENIKVVIISVTEGEDKPIKYPHIFRTSQVMIITKIDLLPYLQFDVQKCIEYARHINPKICIFQVSALTGTGLESWYKWLTRSVS